MANVLEKYMSGSTASDWNPHKYTKSKTAAELSAAASASDDSRVSGEKTLPTFYDRLLAGAKTTSEKVAEYEPETSAPKLLPGGTGVASGSGGNKRLLTYEQMLAAAKDASEKGISTLPTDADLKKAKTAAGAALLKGADAAATGISSTANWLLGEPLKALGWKNNPVSAIDEKLKSEQQKNAQYFENKMDAQGFSDTGKKAADLGSQVVAALPQAVMAYITAGTSLLGEGTTTALQTAAAARASGLAQTIKTGIQSMLKSPNFWTAFAQVAGNNYDEAKADGASDLKASAFATVNGLLNALVEVGGGGIQELPSALQKGKSAVREWVDTMFDEGKENVVQGIMERLLQNVTYQKGNALYSISDENAVVNPTTSAKEYGEGALVGGILGAGQIGASKVLESGPRYLKTGAELATEKSTPETIKTGVTAQGGVTGSSEVPNNNISETDVKSNTESASLIKKLKESIPQIETGLPVATVRGNEFLIGEGKISDRILSFVSDMGGKVTRPGFGDVLFSRAKIKSSLLGHGMSKTKISAFAAVPAVIKNGQQIDYQQNWKGRTYDSYIFAAPVSFAGRNSYLAVVVNKDNNSNRYYLHEVVDGNGDVIYTETPSEPSDGRPGLSAGVDTVAQNEVSNNSIPDSTEKSNSENKVVSREQLIKNWVADGMTRAEAEDAADLWEQRGTRTDVKVKTETDNTQATGIAAWDKLGIQPPINPIAKIVSAESLVAREKGAYKSRKTLQKAIEDLRPSGAEKAFAQGIANGTYEENDIPVSMSAEKVKTLADYYTAADSYKQDTLAERKRAIKREAEAKAEKLVENSDQNKPPKALSLNFNTMKRNFERTFGTDAPALIKEYIDPVRENSRLRKIFVMAMRGRLIKYNLTSAESELTQHVIEGRAAAKEVSQQDPDIKTRVEDYAANKQRAAEIMNEYGISANGKAYNLAKDVANGNAGAADIESALKEDTVSRALEHGDTIAERARTAEGVRKLAANMKAQASLNLSTEQTELAERYVDWLNTQTRLKDADAAKIDAAADTLSETYNDLYNLINEFLVQHGYSPIGFVQGYAPHLQPDQVKEGFAKVLERFGIDTETVELPTDIAGRTETFKPGKQFNPFFLERGKGEVKYDAVEGYERYIDYIANVLYHTDDIMKQRVLGNVLRGKYAPEEIKEQISHAKGLRGMNPKEISGFFADANQIAPGTELTASQAETMLEKYIDSKYASIENMTKYGDFVSVLDDYTNKLAGKQTKFDRAFESLVSRKFLNIGNRLTKIFGESMIVGNLSSALNQTAQIPMLQAEVGNKYVGEALRDILSGELKEADFDRESMFLTGKMAVESAADSRAWSDKTKEQKYNAIMNAASIPFEAVDDFASRLIVRSKYLKEIDAGASHVEALKAADEYADRMVGSREQGMKPMAFENKNIFMKLFTTFQLEVANNWAHITHDIPAEVKEVAQTEGKSAAVKMTAGLIVKYLIQAFLLNRLTDTIYGGTPAPLDLIGYIMSGMAAGKGVSTNKYLLTILDNGLEALGAGRALGTDKLEKGMNTGAFTDEVRYLAGGDVPYASNVLSVLGLSDTTLPLPKVTSDAQRAYKNSLKTAKQQLEEAETTEEREAAQNAVTNAKGKLWQERAENALTWAPLGNQIRKTATGGLALARGGQYTGWGESKQLQYPVETEGAKGLLTGAKALLFGPGSLEAADEYYAAGGKKLTTAYTGAVEKLVKSGVSSGTAYNLIDKVQNVQATAGKTRTEARAEVIAGSGLSDEQKTAVYYDTVASDKEKSAIDEMGGAGELFGILTELRGLDTVAKKRAAIMNYDGLTALQKKILDSALVGDVDTAFDYTSNESYKASQLYSAQYSEYQALSDKIPSFTVDDYRSFYSACDLASSSDGSTRKEKIMDYINFQNLTNDEKTALYLAAGYSEKTLDDAPWYGQPEPKYLPKGSSETNAATENVLAKYLPRGTSAGNSTEKILAKYGLKKGG